MTKKLALALIAAATVGLASPAFSQASLPNTSSLGTGSLLPFAYPVTSEHSARQVQHPALGAFAAEPQAIWNGYSDSPAATGGGTFGYNQGLDNPNY